MISKGAGEILENRRASEATLDVATSMQSYFSQRVPSLVNYLGTLASTAPPKRGALAESLESIVVDSAASLYGKTDLRAVVLHYANGALIPGNFRRGWDSAPAPRLDGTGPEIPAALDLIKRYRLMWVDDPEDLRHLDSLILRPKDSYRSYIRIPLVAGGHGFGLLWVNGREVNSLMEADVAPLGTLAGILATGMALISPTPQCMPSNR